MDDNGLFTSLIMVVSMAGLGGLAVAVTGGRRGPVKFQLGLFMAALALRYAASLAIYQAGLVDVLKDEDGSGWVVGMAFQQAWSEQGLGLLDLPAVLADAYTTHHKGYWYLLGLFFSVVPGSRMAAAALNCFFGSVTVVLAFRIFFDIFGDRPARVASVILCVLPSMILWSAQTIKEPVVMLLEVVAVYGCVRLRASGLSLRHVTAAGLAIALLIPFRFYAAYLAGVTVVVSAVLPPSGRGQFKFGSVLGVLVIATFFVGSGLLAGNESNFKNFDISYIESAKHYGAQFGSGVDVGHDLRTPQGMAAGLSVGAVHLLLAPFPWQLAGGGMRTLLVGPEMIFYWWIVFAGVIPGLFSSLRTRFNDVVPLLVMLLGFGILYSLMFSNVGLIYRQRAQLMPWLMIFAAVGLERRRGRRLAVGTNTLRTSYSGRPRTPADDPGLAQGADR